MTDEVNKMVCIAPFNTSSVCPGARNNHVAIFSDKRKILKKVVSKLCSLENFPSHKFLTEITDINVCGTLINNADELGGQHNGSFYVCLVFESLHLTHLQYASA